MKHFLPITISMLLIPGVASALTGPVTGITCQTGQVCCYYNNAGGCMKCAAAGSCPTCTCPLNTDNDPTICSSTEWTANGTEGTYHRCLQVQSNAALEICGCQYSCMPGYYMTYDATAAKNICVRCPSINGVYGTTVDHNINGITSCYIPTGTSLSDDTGTFEFTSQCNYTN